MTTLVSQTLDTELTQQIKFKLNYRCHIAAMIPYLLVFNAPAGVFTFELYNEDQSETVYTKDFTSADILEALNTANVYAHVFYPIIPENPVQIEKGLYTMKLTATGYIKTEASFLGWIQQFEDVQNEMEYVPFDDSQNPLATRYKQYKEGID